MLRTGVGGARALEPKALAARLHVTIAQVPGLEAQAVHQLRADAARGCGAAISSGGSFAFVGFGGVDGAGTPMYAVAGARYSLQPSGGSRFPGSGGHSLLGSALGADIPPTASDAIIIVLLILAAAGATTLLVAGEAGRVPSYRRVRRRFLRRPTRRP